MSNELMLTQIIKDLGALEQRFNTLEQFVHDGINNEDECIDYEDDNDGAYSNTFAYSLEANKVTQASTNHFRYIKNSMYKVYVAKPFLSEDDPDAHTLMEVDMNREELDRYLAQIPSKNHGAYIYKITPSMDEHL